MTDIFISYSRKDKAMVSKLAAALEAQGYVVWWDHSLHGGQSFAREIHKQIDQAKCAIVVWSQASVESDWVYSEASQAASRGILLTTVYQDALIPHPYNARHNEDLRGWHGRVGTKQFQKLLSAVEKYCPIPSAKTASDDAVVDERPVPPANLKNRKINYPAVVLGILGVGAGGFLMQNSDTPAFWSSLGEVRNQLGMSKTEEVNQISMSSAGVSMAENQGLDALAMVAIPEGARISFPGLDHDGKSLVVLKPGEYTVRVSADYSQMLSKIGFGKVFAIGKVHETVSNDKVVFITIPLYPKDIDQDDKVGEIIFNKDRLVDFGVEASTVIGGMLNMNPQRIKIVIFEKKCRANIFYGKVTTECDRSDSVRMSPYKNSLLDDFQMLIDQLRDMKSSISL